MTHQPTPTARWTILRGTGPKALMDLLETDLVTGEARRQCEAVLAENARLRDENEHLKRMNVIQAAKLEEYQTTHRLVLDGQMRRRWLWQWYRPNLLQGFVLGFGAAVVVVSAIFAAVLMLA